MANLFDALIRSVGSGSAGSQSRGMQAPAGSLSAAPPGQFRPADYQAGGPSSQPNAVMRPSFGTNAPIDWSALASAMGAGAGGGNLGTWGAMNPGVPMPMATQNLNGLPVIGPGLWGDPGGPGGLNGLPVVGNLDYGGPKPMLNQMQAVHPMAGRPDLMASMGGGPTPLMGTDLGAALPQSLGGSGGFVGGGGQPMMGTGPDVSTFGQWLQALLGLQSGGSGGNLMTPGVFSAMSQGGQPPTLSSGGLRGMVPPGLGAAFYQSQRPSAGPAMPSTPGRGPGVPSSQGSSRGVSGSRTSTGSPYRPDRTRLA